jgi:plasmid stabilization system protein ParE
MKIELTEGFLHKLNEQVAFIAQDKPSAARKFKDDILQLCKKLTDHPYKCRPSIYFQNKQIRDLLFKGYVIVYEVNESSNLISIFAMIKSEENIKDSPKK